MARVTGGYLAAPALAFEAQEPAADGSASTLYCAAEVTGASPDFTIIRDMKGFEALEDDWTALHRRCARPAQLFQSFAWNWHWAQCFLSQSQWSGPNCPIAVLTGRVDGRLIALWPMMFSRRRALRELAWMGEPVSQYGDVLIDPTVTDARTVLLAGWAHLREHLRPDLARLRKVRADAMIQPLLEQLGSLKTSELEAPYIDLAKARDFEDYETRFAKRSIRNRRRQMRRLEEAGEVHFRHLDPGADAESAAAEGIEMKRRWLIDRGHVSPALADARMARFMAAVAAANAHPTGTRVGVLDCGGRTAAVQIGFTSGTTRVLHVIAYDRGFEKMAAGVLHLEEAIRHGFNEGLTRIDLLAPKADYKVDWADGVVGVADHAIGLSPKGRAYARLYLGEVRPRLKALIERLPHKARQMLVTSHLKTAARRVMVVFGFS